jgi:hypothetical protein
MRHIVIIVTLMILIEGVRHLANTVEPVPAVVLSSEIYEGSSSRGAGSPVVVISYEFVYREVRRVSSDVYQPKPPWGRVAWTAEERAAAQRYVAERPPGRAIRIAVSKYFPWSNRLLNGDEVALTPNHWRPSWTSFAGAMVSYVLGLMGLLVLRYVKNRRSGSHFQVRARLQPGLGRGPRTRK